MLSSSQLGQETLPTLQSSVTILSSRTLAFTWMPSTRRSTQKRNEQSAGSLVLPYSESHTPFAGVTECISVTLMTVEPSSPTHPEMASAAMAKATVPTVRTTSPPIVTPSCP